MKLNNSRTYFYPTEPKEEFHLVAHFQFMSQNRTTCCLWVNWHLYQMCVTSSVLHIITLCPLKPWCCTFFSFISGKYFQNILYIFEYISEINCHKIINSRVYFNLIVYSYVKCWYYTLYPFNLVLIPTGDVDYYEIWPNQSKVTGYMTKSDGTRTWLVWNIQNCKNIKQ